MRRWPAYPAYKDSGVPWLGEIPDHWATVSLKHGYEVQLGKMLTPEPRSSQDTLEPYLRSANVYWDGVDTSDVKEMWFSAYEKSQYRLVPGDLVVCEGGDVGRAAIWEGQIPECYIQNAVHRVRSRPGYSNKFLYYWLVVLKSAGYIDLICSKATIAHLTAEKLVELPSLAPSADEQHAITAFLDRETAKLDALTRKFERLIEVVQEQRAALISHAVTRGLDPDVPLKDSGVPWLGEIPAHWEVTQFRYVADVSYGLTLQLDRTLTEGIPIISLPNVTKEGQLLLDDVPFAPSLTEAEKDKLLLHRGDLLFNWRNGSPDHIGKTAYFDADGEYTHVSFLLRLRFDPNQHESRYFQIYLGSLRSIGFFGSSKDQVNKTYNQTELRRLEVLVPSLPEQRAIAAYLNREAAKLDALVAKAREAIARLAEYRTALISAAVTGKIDVRET